jgi:hypothetical protein
MGGIGPGTGGSVGASVGGGVGYSAEKEVRLCKECAMMRGRERDTMEDLLVVSAVVSEKE